MDRFNLSRWAIRHPALVGFLIALLFAAGAAQFFTLGRDEDPTFTLKEMIVAAAWPGAFACICGRGAAAGAARPGAGGRSLPLRWDRRRALAEPRRRCRCHHSLPLHLAPQGLNLRRRRRRRRYLLPAPLSHARVSRPRLPDAGAGSGPLSGRGLAPRHRRDRRGRHPLRASRR